MNVEGSKVLNSNTVIKAGGGKAIETKKMRI